MKLDSNPRPKNTSMASLKEVRPTLTPVEKFHHMDWDKMSDKNNGSKPGIFSQLCNVACSVFVKSLK